MNVLELMKRAGSRISTTVDSGLLVLGLQTAQDSSRALRLSELEDRILLSASPMAAAIEPQAEQVAGMLTDAVDPMVDAMVTPEAESPESHDTAVSRELVFVDSGAENYQKLLDDLWSNTDPSRQLDVVLLSSQRDGVEQISETLAQYSGEKLDAVHFITHGTDRAVKLGSTWLDASSLSKNQSLVESWSHSLNSGADLLFYGCDLAGNETGRALLENIALATGADLAASTDDTGAAILGGDWELEFAIGDVTTQVAISELTQTEWTGLLNTFVVTNTNANGDGSLANAIINANNLNGIDTISFAIPGNDSNHFYYADDGVANSVDRNFMTTTNAPAQTVIAGADPDYSQGWWTINVGSGGLPAITEGVIIDGTTQAGFLGTPIIEISGLGYSSSDPNGFTIESSDVTIRGLAINQFGDDAIEIDNDGGNNTIVGNFIGTDVSGMVALGNGFGITVKSDGNIIGGTLAEDQNLISANSGFAIGFWQNAANNRVLGNVIGTRFDQTTPLGNQRGITFQDGARNNVIGGTAQDAGNIISNTNNAGILLYSDSGSGNTFLANVIYESDGLGIDHDNDGISANSSTGANGLQNFPVITSAELSEDDLTVSGTLTTSDAFTQYRIEFFGLPAGIEDETHGEGQYYLGAITVATDDVGFIDFTDVVLSGADLNVSDIVTATATEILSAEAVISGDDLNAYGDTSEFSENEIIALGAIVVVDPPVTNSPTTVNISGNSTVEEGEVYTLNLSATDPDGIEITGWTINWGDGTIDNIAGNPPSVTHTYTTPGESYNIIAQAHDPHGTWVEQDLIVSALTRNSLFQFDFETGNFLSETDSYQPGGFPVGMTIGQDGLLYVTDSNTDQVLRYNSSTMEFIDVFIDVGSSGTMQFFDSAFLPNGNMLVSTLLTGQILQFDANGEFVNVFADSGIGGMTSPGEIIVGPDLQVYVSEIYNDQILRFGLNGSFVGVVINAADGLNQPMQMDFGPDGRLYVASSSTNQILAVDTTLGVATEFVSIAQPMGLQFGPDGDLYVSSGLGGSIDQFDGTTGAFVKTLVASGSHNFTEGLQLQFASTQTVTVLNDAPTGLSTGITINDGPGNNVYLEAQRAGEILGDLETITLEAIFEIKEPNTKSNTILSYASGSNYNELYLTILNDGHILFGVKGNDTNEFISANSYLELIDGETHHLAVSWNGGTGNLIIYIDGIEAESASSFENDSVLSFGGTLLLGQDQNSSGLDFEKSFNGTLYDIRIWEDVRTSSEIDEHHHHKFSNLNVPEGLIANWQMTEIESGDTIRDLVNPFYNDLQIKNAGTLNGFVAGTATDLITVLESSADGTYVTTVIPTDATVESGTPFQFMFLPDGNADGRFAIDSTTGAITVADGSLLRKAMGTVYTVTISVNDPTGNQYIQNLDIHLTSDSLPTSITFGELGKIYTESSPPMIIDGSVFLADQDGAELDGATLTIELVSGSTINDVLDIESSGDVINDDIGKRILVQGTEVATWSQSTGSLVITFGSNTTLENVQHIARHITFENTSSAPSTDTRTVQFELVDANSVRSSAQKSIGILTVNNAPGVDLNGNSPGFDTDLTFDAGDLPVSLANGIIIRDGGEDDIREIRIVANGLHQDGSNEAILLDTLSFNYGTPFASTVLVGDTLIFFDYDGDASLDFYNANSGVSIPIADAELLISQLSYRNSALNPTAGVRTISIQAFDLFGASGNPGVARVQVASSQTAPQLFTNTGLIVFNEGDGSVQIDENASITDTSASSFVNSVLTANITANGTASDQLAIQNHISTNGIEIVVTGNLVFADTVQVGTISGGTQFDTGNEDPLQITFNANATLPRVEAVLQAIQFSNDSENPSQTSRTISVSLLDGEGDQSNTVSQFIVVLAVNDAPIIDAPNSISLNENQSFYFVGSDTISFSDDADGSEEVAVTLSVDTGSLTLGSTANLTFQIGDGNSDNLISLRGSIDDVNTALFGLRFNPNANYTGNASLTITVNDQGNTGSDPGDTGDNTSEQDSETILISVEPFNNVPYQDGIFAPSINEGDDLTLDAGAWIDLDGDSLTFRWDLNGNGIYGEAGEPIGASATITWEDLQDFGIIDDGSYFLAVQADDGQGGLGVGGMGLQINNTAPTANDDSGVGFTLSEDDGTITFDVLANDSDPADGDPLSLIAFDDTGLIGNLISNGDGTFTYSPDGQFDYLAQGESTTQSFNYTISDGDGATDLAAVTITIHGANDAPTITQSTISLNEGDTIPITNGNLNVLDFDQAPASLIWTVTSVTHGQFEDVANPGSAILTFTHQQVLDGDIQFTHDGSNDVPTFNVMMSDGIAFETAIGTVVFTAAPPTITTTTFALDEGTGPVIGTIQTNDVDSASPQFSIVPSLDGAQFSIDSSSGELRFNTIPDFEAPTNVNGDNIYLVRVRVDDSNGMFAEQDIQVTVNDLNDSVPVITPGQQFTIAENLVNMDPVGTVLADDADTVGSLQNWQIQSGNDDGIFTIDLITGELSILDQTALDYESATRHDLTITVSDGINSSISETVTVLVTDVNESTISQVVDIDATLNRVLETDPDNSPVGITVAANDADGTDTVTYSLTDDASGRFQIEQNTGVITIASALDAELATSHDVTVRALSTDGSESFTTLTIEVIDVSEFAITGIVDADSSQDIVNENAAIGTTVGVQAFADDYDQDDFVRYELTDDAGNRFAIDEISGVITVNGLLDFESNPSHLIIVRAYSTDGGETSISRTIFVRDVNESPTDIAPDTASVDEQTPTGTYVTQLTADDVDAGETFTWTLLDTAGGRFTIDSGTGIVRVNDGTILDHFVTSSHNIHVLVTDSGGESYQEWVEIDVLNVNEAPTISVSDVTINEGLAIGTVIETASATDFDNGDIHTFSIANGNSAGIFTINPSSGTISVIDNTNLSFDLNPSITLTIQVQDLGGLIDTAEMDVTVLNVNTAPVGGEVAPLTVSQFDTLTLSRDQLLSSVFDADGDVLMPILVSQPSNGTVTVNPDGSFLFEPSTGETGLVTFSYVVSDGIEESAEITVSVTVHGIAPPVDTSDPGSESDPANEESTNPESEHETPNESETDNETEEQPESEIDGNVASGPSSPFSTVTNTGVEDAEATEELQKQAAAEAQESLQALITSMLEDSDTGREWGFRSTKFHSESMRSAAKYVEAGVRLSVERTTGLPVTTFIQSAAFWNDLDELEQSISSTTQSSAKFETAVVGTTAAVTGGLTVGYVVWLIRGGSLLATMVSVLPSWSSFDPLPILERFESATEEEDDDLAGLIANSLN